MVPPLHLLTTAGILHRSRIVISNDTGLMHLAAAVGTPVVGIFGPTDPAVYSTPIDNVIALGGAHVSCEKHGKHFAGIPQCWGERRCPSRPESCINEVRLHEVKAAVQKLLRLPRETGTVVGTGTLATESLVSS